MKKAIAKLKERIKGFTLIELLIVIAIIGILSSSAIVSTNMARKKARDARRLTDIQQIANAMEIYLDSNDRKYPDSLGALVPNYIASLPRDPLTQAGYFYCSNGTAGGVNDGTTFHLAAAMEEFNPTFFDKDADLEVDGCENLAGNLSFNGYSEACASTQKCNGENCDGCLDFTNIVTPGFPGDDDGGDNGGGGGNGGGGDNGGGNSNSCGNLNLAGSTGDWDLDVYIYPYNNGIARVSWTPPQGAGTRYTTYAIKMTGWFQEWIPGGGTQWVEKETRIESDTQNNFFELHNLKPGTNYSVYVEARLGSTIIEKSNTALFTSTTNCGNGTCDDGEKCSDCSIDCKNN